MPVFNGQRFLPAAIDSILAQSFVDFELIIVDDGSTDESVEMARAYAARDRRITFVAGTHGGIAVATNRALAAARGVYFAPMDQDDVATPERLAREADYLDAHPDTLAVGGAAEIIDAKGSVLRLKRPPTAPSAVAAALHRSCAIIHPGSMMRTEAARSVGGYRSILPFAQDYDLWLRLMEKGDMANLSEVVLLKREHARQVTSTRPQRPGQVIAGAIAYLSYLSRRWDGADLVDSGQPLRQAAAIFIDRQLAQGTELTADALHHFTRFMRYAPIETGGERRFRHPYRACIRQAFRHGGVQSALRAAAYISLYLLRNRYRRDMVFPDEVDFDRLTALPSAPA